MTRKNKIRRPKMKDYTLDIFTKAFGKPRKFKGTLQDGVAHTPGLGRKGRKG